MKEYVKLFNTASAATDYSIVDIPFTSTVKLGGGGNINLTCNEEGKKIAVDGNNISIVDDGPEPPTMIDLGLSVKWAQYNFGVNPTQLTEASDWYGSYYAWGEVNTKSDYSWGTYAFGTKTIKSPFSKYDTDGKTVLEAVDDICTATYGAGYRMPTKTEIEELIELQNEWVTNYNGITGLNGRVFTAGNGNTLFIPAAGKFNGTSVGGAGGKGFVWSSSLSSGGPYGAMNLYFESGGVMDNHDSRCLGLSVRCVSTI